MNFASIFTILVYILLPDFAYSQEKQQVHFSPILIEKACADNMTQSTIRLYTSSDETIEIFDFRSNLRDLYITGNEYQDKNSDRIEISKEKGAELVINFHIPSKKDQLSISFKTNESKNSFYSIPITLNSFKITTEDIRNKSEVTLDISGSCSDSIRVYFPYGGTVSTVCVYREITEDSFIKSTGYYSGESDNYLTFPTSPEARRYFIRFGACHWANNFWLNLK